MRRNKRNLLSFPPRPSRRRQLGQAGTFDYYWATDPNGNTQLFVGSPADIPAGYTNIQVANITPQQAAEYAYAQSPISNDPGVTAAPAGVPTPASSGGQQMYSLAQLQSLNGSACYLTGPDGNSYTPAQYAMQFYQTQMPELNPCAGVVAAPAAAAAASLPSSPTSPAPTAATGLTIDTGIPIDTTPAAAVPQGVIYRLILAEPDGTFATGANYSGCSQSATQYCDPQSFESLQAAVNYALQGNEIPVLVSSEAQAWQIVAGNVVPSAAQILSSSSSSSSTPASSSSSSLLSSPLTIGALIVGAYLLFRKGA